jgi:hypothetical protein
MRRARLVACSACARHVRADERPCPFCAASLPDFSLGGLALEPPHARLGRADLYHYGAVGGLALAACGGQVLDPPRPVDPHPTRKAPTHGWRISRTPVSMSAWPTSFAPRASHHSRKGPAWLWATSSCRETGMETLVTAAMVGNPAPHVVNPSPLIYDAGAKTRRV